jgi:hypothetical protein
MATRKQKQELLDVLKFTPIECKLSMWGYGGEAVIGTLGNDAKHGKRIWDYFRKNKIDVSSYAYDFDNEAEVPEKVQPFEPGQWHDCDDIAHESGVELSEACGIEITGPDGAVIWKSTLDIDALEEQGVQVTQFSEDYVYQQPVGSFVFYGQSFEKGTFFDAEFTLNKPFDPTRLELLYCDVDGWLICSSVNYDEESVENYDISTTGKSAEYAFYRVTKSGAERYSSPED